MGTIATSPRFSERHFRRYEPTIKKIVDNWPVNTIIDPKPLSTETFSCRLRDAIRSHRENQWVSDINMPKFIQVCDEIVVSTSVLPGRVAAGLYESLKVMRPMSTIDTATIDEQSIPTINLVDPPEDLIKSVICLHHHNLLIEPSTIKSPLDVESFVASYDVSIEQDTPGVYTIL